MPSGRGRERRLQPKDNVIILTAGLCGSSVVAGLLRGAGYWVGADTFKKPDYDTNENRDLVALNERLLKEAGFRERFDRVFRPGQSSEVERHLADIPTGPYRQFIEACDRHAPFVWKDPRLRLTIGFWARLLDRDRLRILVVSRRQSQLWVSHLLRGQVLTPLECREFNEGVRSSSLDFAAAHRLPCFEIVYEDLLLAPERVLRRLGDFLGTEISLSDLGHAFRGGVPARPHGAFDFLRAVMVYGLHRARQPLRMLPGDEKARR